jgi:hypothetical protein
MGLKWSDFNGTAMAIDQTLAQRAGLTPAKAEIAGTIKQAADKTGTSFEYLVSAAKIESNLNPTAAAPTSSARGLYQFIEQTWLGTVKEAGGKFGYGKYADAITRTSSGRYEVSDPAARAEILKLRNDPAANAAMAGVLTQSNSFKLVGEIGRRPTDGELYMAHFMGVRGASRLINNAENNPNATAANLFPAAANANRSIFYERSGRARSVSEVYSVLNTRYANAANSPVARTAIAAAGGTVPMNVAQSSTVPQAQSVSRVALARAPVELSAFPDLNAIPVASRQGAQPVAQPQQVASVQRDEPMFRSLFKVGERSEPVSPAVSELWGNGSSLTASIAQPNVSGETQKARPLDLFRDPSGIYSS